MVKKDKLLQRARRNPKGISFSDFETLLSHSGWVFDHQSGSHRIWYSKKKIRLPIQKGKGNNAKPYQVKQFFKIYDEEQ